MIKETEIEHDKKLLKEGAEKIWGRAGLAGTKRLERRAKMIIDFAQIKPGKKILEIGCGSGTLTEKLAAGGAEITATDIFPEFLELTEKKAGGNIKTQIADAETLANFADNTFDAVVGLSILHHLNLDKTLTNIYRVLKPEGIMAFSEPNMLNPQIALQKNIPFLKKALGDSPEETAFFAGPLKKKLVSLNFQSVRVIPFDFLHPAIPDFMAGGAEKIGDLLEKTPLIKEIAGSLFIVAKK